VAVFSGNKPVSDLKAADFDVTDNGVPQVVREVIYESQPIDVTLVLDTSGSVSGNRLQALVRGVNRIRERVRRDDRISVVTFGQQVRELFGLTEARETERVALSNATGPTALYDAIAVSLASPPAVGRRQMAIVFTDGIDTVSFLDEAAVLDVARRSRTAVFIVALGRIAGTFGSGTFGQLVTKDLPEAFFAELAELTGGAADVVPAIRVESAGGAVSMRQNDNILDQPFLKAFDDFRTSYVLRYTLEGVPRAGWHQVDVRVTRPERNLSIRARRGYDGGR
jgi:VWFA-related protein